MIKLKGSFKRAHVLPSTGSDSAHCSFLISSDEDLKKNKKKQKHHQLEHREGNGQHYQCREHMETLMYASELVLPPRKPVPRLPASLGVVETFSAHLRLIREIKRKDSSAIVFSSQGHVTVRAASPCPRKGGEPHRPDGPRNNKKGRRVYVIYSERNKETKTCVVVYEYIKARNSLKPVINYSRNLCAR